MLTLGEYHTLTIDRDTEPGLFLKDQEGNEVLLPNKYKPETFDLEDEIEVFVYLDHQERPVATTLKPTAAPAALTAALQPQLARP